MSRKLFTLAAGVSAALWVAAAILWVWSGLVHAAAQRDRQARFDSHERLVQAAIERTRSYSESLGDATAAELEHVNELQDETNRLVGERNSLDRSLALGAAPRPSVYPWVMEGAAVLPIGWVLRRGWLRAQRWGRQQKNLCVKCGYDLRATPERCPECGAVPGAKGAVA